ncbi:MAG: right-handed parallel beta-helix repeat-containing protein, partial [bacterium]
KVEAGDTVKIDANTYSETVAIPVDNLAMLGVDSGPTGTKLDYGDSSASTGAIGVYSDTQTGLYLTDLQLRNYYKAVYFENIDQSTVKNLRMVYSGDNAIETIRSNRNSFSGNHFVRNDSAGILLAHSSKYNEVFDNTADSGGSFGLNSSNSSGNRFENNQLDSNDGGIRITGASRGNTVANNIVRSSEFSPGISITGNAALNKIANNEIRDGNDEGIKITTDTNTIKNNLTRNNGLDGIQLNGDNNTLVSNHSYLNIDGFEIDANRNTLKDNRSDTNTDNGFEIAGNRNVLRSDSASNNSAGFELASAQSNKIIQVYSDNNTGKGFRLAGAVNNRFISNEVTGNDESGIYMTADSSGNPAEGNYFAQNDIIGNGNYEVHLVDNKGDTFNKNLMSFYGDTTVRNDNGSGRTFDFTRNDWNTTNENSIAGDITGTYDENVDFKPFRLTEVKLSPGADTIAPNDPTIKQAKAVPGGIKVTWYDVDYDENFDPLNDFGKYNVYGLDDSQLPTSDWKQTAESNGFDTTVESRTDTSVIHYDNVHRSYSYRVTAEDNS